MRTRRSIPLTVAMLAALAYFLIPLFWLAVSSTKSTQDLRSEERRVGKEC